MYFTTIQRAIVTLHLFTFLIYYLFSMNVFYNNTKSNCYPTLIHFSLFPNVFFSLILDFIKLLCTRDFSRVNFATELSTKIVYKSIFAIVYNYICIFLLFFFTVKLSIFSRLCVKLKRVMSRSTHTEI